MRFTQFILLNSLLFLWAISGTFCLVWELKPPYYSHSVLHTRHCSFWANSGIYVGSYYVAPTALYMFVNAVLCIKKTFKGGTIILLPRAIALILMGLCIWYLSFQTVPVCLNGKVLGRFYQSLSDVYSSAMIANKCLCIC